MVSSTPNVQYTYADGSAGTVRATGLTYPNGRSLSFDDGASGSIDDAAGRIAGIKEGTMTLAGYGYLDARFSASGERMRHSPTAFGCHHNPSRLWPPASRLLRDRDPSGDGVLDERLDAVQDGNWNVTTVCDENGAVQERYAYTAYGEPLFLSPGFVEQSGSSLGWEVLFTGQRWDAGSRIFGFRYRQCSAALAVFLARAPIGYFDGTKKYTWAVSGTIMGWERWGYTVGGMSFVRRDVKAPTAKTESIYHSHEWWEHFNAEDY